MLTEYIDSLMKRARFETLDDGTLYGEIPDCPGVWVDGDDPDRCRRELREILEEWIVLKLRDRDLLPVVDGIDLNLRAA